MDRHNTDEEDTYRNEPQGYIVKEDADDNRIDMVFGTLQWFYLGFFFILGASLVQRKHLSKRISHNMSEALLVSQHIEDAIERL